MTFSVDYYDVIFPGFKTTVVLFKLGSCIIYRLPVVCNENTRDQSK